MDRTSMLLDFSGSVADLGAFAFEPFHTIN
jgi:hypothetical protein